MNDQPPAIHSSCELSWLQRKLPLLPYALRWMGWLTPCALALTVIVDAADFPEDRFAKLAWGIARLGFLIRLLSVIACKSPRRPGGVLHWSGLGLLSIGGAIAVWVLARSCLST